MANEIESSEYCELDPIKDKAKDSIDWEGLAFKMAHKKQSSALCNSRT